MEMSKEMLKRKKVMKISLKLKERKRRKKNKLFNLKNK